MVERNNKHITSKIQRRGYLGQGCMGFLRQRIVGTNGKKRKEVDNILKKLVRKQVADTKS